MLVIVFVCILIQSLSQIFRAAWSLSSGPTMSLPGTATNMMYKKQLSSEKFEAK
jgi:hypothetical protein